jgi:medium-chain acyl-[acyl-carrier-protein] hydrolase
MKPLSSTPWLQYWQPKPGARVRLFCFPYAGGSAGLFRTWSAQLPLDIEVCPIQLPGREQRIGEKPYTSLSELINSLLFLLDQYLDRPFAFFGHSMGALISFEFARALHRTHRHVSPIHLFVSAHRAPQLPSQHPPIHSLSDILFLDELRRFNGTPEDVLQHAELLQLLLPLLRADFTLAETYHYIPERPLSCPISVFGGLQDLENAPATLEAWSEQTSKLCKVYSFPGDHFYIRQSQTSLLSILAQELIQDLQIAPE